MLLRGLLASEIGGGGATYAAWNPLDKDSSITLSGGNQVASGSVFGSRIVRADTAISGKRYFEFSFTPNTDNVGVGICSSGVPLTSYLGQNALSYGHYLPSNDSFTGGSAAYNGTTNSTTPIIVGMAVDGTSVWIIVQGGSGFEGGGDPAAGTSPTLTVTSGTYFPACTPYSGSNAVTLNAGQSAFALWTPSGGFAGITA